MKRILSSVLAIALLVGTANAQSQNKQKHAGRKEHRQMVLKGIDLTAEQQSQVKVINKNYRAQLEALRTQKLTAEEAKTKKQSLHQQHTSDIRAILTPDQKAKLERARSARTNTTGSTTRFEKKDGGKRKWESYTKRKALGEQLDLTADQKAKMKALNQSFKARFDALRKDDAQSKEVKKSKLEDLKKERQESVKAILTAEQQSKIQSYRKRSKAVTK